MEEKGFVKSIWIYPVKSLDGIEIQRSSFNRSGGLSYDRTFTLKDLSGEYINAKNYPEIIKVRTSFNIEEREIIFSILKKEEKFNLENEIGLIEEWFSDFLNKKVQLHKNEEIGFPDDRKRSGPTVYSLQSLKLIHEWFPDLSLNELRRRFRGNIELSAQRDGFWEDDLLSDNLQPGQFKIGNVEFQAAKPCPRCPVPSRSSIYSSIYQGFQKKYTELRKMNISQSVNKEYFPHYYMFALNTYVNNSENKFIKSGDELMF